MGAGLSVYHGVSGLLNPEDINSYNWAFYVLGGSLVSESVTLLVAINSIKRGAQQQKMSFLEYGNL